MNKCSSIGARETDLCSYPLRKESEGWYRLKSPTGLVLEVVRCHAPEEWVYTPRLEYAWQAAIYASARSMVADSSSSLQPDFYLALKELQVELTGFPYRYARALEKLEEHVAFRFLGENLDWFVGNKERDSFSFHGLLFHQCWDGYYELPIPFARDGRAITMQRFKSFSGNLWVARLNNRNCAKLPFAGAAATPGVALYRLYKVAPDTLVGLTTELARRTFSGFPGDMQVFSNFVETLKTLPRLYGE